MVSSKYVILEEGAYLKFLFLSGIMLIYLPKVQQTVELPFFVGTELFGRYQKYLWPLTFEKV